MSEPRGRIRIGADVGGTFTDVLLLDSTGKIWTQKVPSTPPDPWSWTKQPVRWIRWPPKLSATK